MQHSIVQGSVDEDRVGICTKCGEVKVQLSTAQGRLRWRCSVSAWETSQKRRGEHGMTRGGAKVLTDSVGACEVCGFTERLVVDHNHETGMIRGVLCHYCNTALGLLYEDPERTKRLMEFALRKGFSPN